MLFRKYRYYKKLLYTFVFINIGLMALGLVAAVRYFKESQLRDGEMAFVGLAILIFGILLPMFIIKKIEDMYKEWELLTKKLISEWLAAWVEIQTNRNPDAPLFKDFSFWLSMAIVGMNAAQNEIKNPYFKFFAQLAGLIQEALKEEHLNNKHSKKKKA